MVDGRSAVGAVDWLMRDVEVGVSAVAAGSLVPVVSSPLPNGGPGADGRYAGRICLKVICCARSDGREAGAPDDTSGAVSTALSLSMARSRGG